MSPSIEFFVFFVAIQQYYFVDCFAPGSLIWSRNLQSFIPIANVSMFEANNPTTRKYHVVDRRVEMAISRKKEIHNFKRQTLVLGYFEDENSVKFNSQFTKVTGACGEMWNILADYSNFTLATTLVKRMGSHVKRGNNEGTLFFQILNGWVNIIPKIAFTEKNRRVMDLTTPIWETRHKLYIQLERKADTNWMFNMFSYKVWCAIIMLLLILSASGYLMEKILAKEFPDEECRHNYIDHLFYTFATLCSQGFSPDTLDRGSKVFGLAKKIFAWLLLLVFSSHLISYMTDQKLQPPPFDDIDSLLVNTSYKVAMYSRSIAYDQLEVLKMALQIRGYNVTERLKKSRSRTRLYADACAAVNKTAIFALEDAKQPLHKRFCELTAIGKAYFPTWVTFGLSKRLPYRRTFDIGILKMREFGLIDGLKKRWLKPQTINADTIKHASFTPVNLDQVAMLLIIFFSGIVMSVSIFVVENIVYVFKRYRRRIVRGKLLTENKLTAYRNFADNRKNNANVVKSWTIGFDKKNNFRERFVRCLSKIFRCRKQ